MATKGKNQTSATVSTSADEDKPKHRCRRCTKNNLPECKCGNRSVCSKCFIWGHKEEYCSSNLNQCTICKGGAHAPSNCPLIVETNALCANCNAVGHSKKNCPKEVGDGATTAAHATKQEQDGEKTARCKVCWLDDHTTQTCKHQVCLKCNSQHIECKCGSAAWLTCSNCQERGHVFDHCLKKCKICLLTIGDHDQCKCFLIQCYHCREFGHSVRFCENPYLCLHCNERHDLPYNCNAICEVCGKRMQRCQCYRRCPFCRQFGHTRSKCILRSTYCYRCDKRGHKADNCQLMRNSSAKPARNTMNQSRRHLKAFCSICGMLNNHNEVHCPVVRMQMQKHADESEATPAAETEMTPAAETKMTPAAETGVKDTDASSSAGNNNDERSIDQRQEELNEKKRDNLDDEQGNTSSATKGGDDKPQEGQKKRSGNAATKSDASSIVCIMCKLPGHEMKDCLTSIPAGKACRFCKKQKQHAETCRVRKRLCKTCGRTGHTSKDCPIKKTLLQNESKVSSVKTATIADPNAVGGSVDASTKAGTGAIASKSAISESKKPNQVTASTKGATAGGTTKPATIELKKADERAVKIAAQSSTGGAVAVSTESTPAESKKTDKNSAKIATQSSSGVAVGNEQRVTRKTSSVKDSKNDNKSGQKVASTGGKTTSKGNEGNANRKKLSGEAAVATKKTAPSTSKSCSICGKEGHASTECFICFGCGSAPAECKCGGTDEASKKDTQSGAVASKSGAVTDRDNTEAEEFEISIDDLNVDLGESPSSSTRKSIKIQLKDVVKKKTVDVNLDVDVAEIPVEKSAVKVDLIALDSDDENSDKKKSSPHKTDDKPKPPPMHCFKCWAVSLEGDKNCFVCGKTGHSWYDCETYSGDNICYKCTQQCLECGKDTHTTGRCPERKKSIKKSSNKNEKTCFNCGDNHSWRDCPKRCCYVCGGKDHGLLQCPKAPWFKDNQCVECEFILNHARSCPVLRKTYCDKCGDKHRSSLCPYTASTKLCWHCKSAEHLPRECPSIVVIDISDGEDGAETPSAPSRSAWEARSSVKECFKCGQSGHHYQDCPKSLKAVSAIASKRTMCFKCGLGATHATNECPLQKKSKQKSADKLTAAEVFAPSTSDTADDEETGNEPGSAKDSKGASEGAPTTETGPNQKSIPFQGQDNSQWDSGLNKCSNCYKMGHFEADCKQSPVLVNLNLKRKITATASTPVDDAYKKPKADDKNSDMGVCKTCGCTGHSKDHCPLNDALALCKKVEERGKEVDKKELVREKKMRELEKHRLEKMIRIQEQELKSERQKREVMKGQELMEDEMKMRRNTGSETPKVDQSTGQEGTMMSAAHPQPLISTYRAEQKTTKKSKTTSGANISVNASSAATGPSMQRPQMGGPQFGGPGQGSMMGGPRPMQGPMGGPQQGPVGGPMQGPMGGPMQGPTGGPMQGPTGGPMQGPMGGPMQGPMGRPMQGPMGGPQMQRPQMGGPMQRTVGGPMQRPMGGNQMQRPQMGGPMPGSMGGPMQSLPMSGPMQPPPMGGPMPRPPMGGQMQPPPMGGQMPRPPMGGPIPRPPMGGPMLRPPMGGPMQPPPMGGPMLRPPMGGPPMQRPYMGGPPYHGPFPNIPQPFMGGPRPVGPPPIDPRSAGGQGKLESRFEDPNDPMKAATEMMRKFLAKSDSDSDSDISIGSSRSRSRSPSRKSRARSRSRSRGNRRGRSRSRSQKRSRSSSRRRRRSRSRSPMDPQSFESPTRRRDPYPSSYPPLPYPGAPYPGPPMDPYPPYGPVYPPYDPEYPPMPGEGDPRQQLLDYYERCAAHLHRDLQYDHPPYPPPPGYLYPYDYEEPPSTSRQYRSRSITPERFRTDHGTNCICKQCQNIKQEERRRLHRSGSRERRRRSGSRERRRRSGSRERRRNKGRSPSRRNRSSSRSRDRSRRTRSRSRQRDSHRRVKSRSKSKDRVPKPRVKDRKRSRSKSNPTDLREKLKARSRSRDRSRSKQRDLRDKLTTKSRDRSGSQPKDLRDKLRERSRSKERNRRRTKSRSIEPSLEVPSTSRKRSSSRSRDEGRRRDKDSKHMSGSRDRGRDGDHKRSRDNDRAQEREKHTDGDKSQARDTGSAQAKDQRWSTQRYAPKSQDRDKGSAQAKDQHWSSSASKRSSGREHHHGEGEHSKQKDRYREIDKDRHRDGDKGRGRDMNTEKTSGDDRGRSTKKMTQVDVSSKGGDDDYGASASSFSNLATNYDNISSGSDTEDYYSDAEKDTGEVLTNKHSSLSNQAIEQENLAFHRAEHEAHRQDEEAGAGGQEPCGSISEESVDIYGGLGDSRSNDVIVDVLGDDDEPGVNPPVKESAQSQDEARVEENDEPVAPRGRGQTRRGRGGRGRGRRGRGRGTSGRGGAAATGGGAAATGGDAPEGTAVAGRTLRSRTRSQRGRGVGSE